MMLKTIGFCSYCQKTSPFRSNKRVVCCRLFFQRINNEDCPLLLFVGVVVSFEFQIAFFQVRLLDEDDDYILIFLLSVGVVYLLQYKTSLLMVRFFNDDSNICILSSLLFVGVLILSQYRRVLLTVRLLEHENENDDKGFINIKLNKVQRQ